MGSGLAAMGLRPNEVVGMTIAEYLGDAPKALRAHRRALAGDSVSFDQEQDGRVFMVRVEPLRDAAAEEALRRAAKEESLTVLAGALASTSSSSTFRCRGSAARRPSPA